ncbi:MAG: iron ABC transporter permease, partial [Anaerolineae bacterium]|nr:iron ABC transporter permease [Anaerolineae bacterium]
ALYTLSDFGAVALMQYDAFTRVIFTQYTSAFDRSLAASLSLVLVAVTGSLLILERRVARGRGANGSRGAGHHHAHAHYRLGAGAARGLQPVRLGRWRGPALAFCAALVGLGVVVPVAVLLTWLTSAQRVAPTGTDLLGPALNTFWAGLLTALVVGAAGLPLAILGARGVGRFGRGLAQAAYLGNGLPGLVIALALVFFGANLVPALYQTLPLLIFGYAIRFLPLSVGATRSALAQINPRFEEAGCSLGLSPWWVAWRVTVPLARAGVLGGMALAFLSAARELPATLLLAPTGFRTLTTEIWMAQAQARYTQAAAPALLIILLSALSLALILRGNHKAGKRA